jgi:hypothetical protein
MRSLLARILALAVLLAGIGIGLSPDAGARPAAGHSTVHTTAQTRPHQLSPVDDWWW